MAFSSDTFGSGRLPDRHDLVERLGAVLDWSVETGRAHYEHWRRENREKLDDEQYSELGGGL